MGESTEGALEFEAFDALTFDCYGTLVDWKRAVVSALRPLLSAHGAAGEGAEIQALFARFESAARERAYRPYRDVLAEVVGRFGAHYGFTPSPEERESLAEAVADCEPFADTRAALGALEGRHRLAVISNTDDDLIARTLAPLDMAFDEVVTAQQAGCYKPSRGIFELALARLGCAPGAVLHVGQWIEGDVVPAKKLGMGSVWVRRTPAAGARADEGDVSVPDLAALVSLMGLRA